MTEEIYRQCASIAVLRPSSVCMLGGCATLYEVLLVHKPRKNDAWQLPQGGCELGESLEEAAIREVQEEAGITPTIIETSEQEYRYDFPRSYRKFRPDNVKGQCVKYVFATVDSGAQVRVDEKEIDGYAWVLPEQFSQYIDRDEYRNIVRKLYEDGVAILGNQQPKT